MVWLLLVGLAPTERPVAGYVMGADVAGVRCSVKIMSLRGEVILAGGEGPTPRASRGIYSQ
ncbi:hypothetical protein MED193_06074 [Roseobacter sp. MED193]|uniref:hypothetical protein n=1 Tax=Roseobacter sp. MED193 TaxID=314262 RepID=UPI000068ED51|nr:hypothetical protein [Roseobacter sp. MED193]EAQ45936.1 hypothetical protein MED193_06074 [Roseobacter sp. MED193]